MKSPIRHTKVAAPKTPEKHSTAQAAKPADNKNASAKPTVVQNISGKKK